MYSEIEFQIEVPEKMNALRNNSVLGLGVYSWTLEDGLSNLEWISDVQTKRAYVCASVCVKTQFV